MKVFIIVAILLVISTVASAQQLNRITILRRSGIIAEDCDSCTAAVKAMFEKNVDSVMFLFTRGKGFSYSTKDTGIKRADYILQCTIGRRIGQFGSLKGQTVYFSNMDVRDVHTDSVFSIAGMEGIRGEREGGWVENADLAILKMILSAGGFVSYLFPVDQPILSPINRSSGKVSFSFDGISATAPLQGVADTLKALVNNALVFYQEGYEKYNSMKGYDYLYFPKYRDRELVDKHTDFQIKGDLREDKGRYLLAFSFTGKSVNLLVPNKIDPIVVISKTELQQGYYNNTLLKISILISSFVHQQLF